MARPFKDSCSRVPPFTVGGVIPWGGKEDRRVFPRDVEESEREGILRDCWAIVQVGLAVARLPDASDMERMNSTVPIDARSLVRGICDYRDTTPGMKTETLSWAEFRAEQRVTPLDVTTYIARIVDRLLIESRFPHQPVAGGYPTNSGRMKARLRETQTKVSQLANLAGVDISIPGPATQAHAKAMAAHRE
jgi:hypothetical protein